MAKKKIETKPHFLIELYGWYGAVAIVAAYGLISFEIIKPEDLVYQLLNLSGSVGILLASLQKKDYQPVLLNTFWILIAVGALATILF